MLKKLFICIFWITSIVLAQSFTASVDRNPVALDEPFQVSFTYAGTDVNGITNFQPPKFADFLVLAGPFQSTSMQIINGAMSGSRTFTYNLRAKNIGKFKIEPASVIIKNSNTSSNSLTIEVVKGSGTQKQNNTQNNQGQTSEKDLAENVFIRTIVDKTNAVKGEQITVIYKLYLRLNIAQPQVSKLPSFTGFWAEELETPATISLTRENYNGKLFNVAVLKKVALFPTEYGELSVAPFEMKIPVYIQKRRTNNNFFDDFFDDPMFGQQEVYEYQTKSNLVKVKVAPLPKTELTSFRGAVGSFSLTTEVNKKRLKQNETINLKLNISGTGNIKLIEPPEITIPNGFEKYDPNVSENINRSSVISGKRTYDYLLIPRTAGSYQIPELEWTYFDLAKNNYVTLRTNQLDIEVEQGDGNYSSGSNLSREEVKLLGQDIRFIKLDKPDFEGNTFFIFRFWYWLIFSFSLASFIVLYVFFKKDVELRSDTKKWKYSKAYKTAVKRINKLEKLLKNKKTTDVYNSIYSIINEFLEAKLKISKADLNLQNIFEILIQKNIDESIINDLKYIIEKCEIAKFASGFNAEENSEELLNKLKELILVLSEVNI